MSENERRIPGERLISRVLSRGTVRPSVGTPAAFYERFGLADPMAERGFVAQDAMGDGDLFSFLSAEPYYAALRAQASWRSHRARRRLLGRLAAQSDAFSSTATRTMRGAPPAGSSVRVALGARMASDSLFTALERPVSREELIEELEAEGWTPGVTTRREASTRRLRRSARRVAPAARTVLEAVETAAPVTARRAIERVRHKIVDLPEVEQVRVVKQLARSVRGPLRRLATQAIERSTDTVSARPIDVALDRQRPQTTRRKSLRPVMHASPSFKTLFFEEPTSTDAVTPAPRLRRERIPAAPSQRTVRREASSTPATRGVRTQQTAGRAGPLLQSVATATPTTRSAQSTPTARVARRVRALTTISSMPTLRGVDAIEPTAQAASQSQGRMVRRATLPSVQAALSASPTAYLQAEEASPRVSRRWLAPTPASANRAPSSVASRATASDASSARAQSTVETRTVSRQPAPQRRVVVQTATGFQYITPVGTEEVGVDATPARTRAPKTASVPAPRQGRRSQTREPMVGGLARAARRAGPGTSVMESVPAVAAATRRSAAPAEGAVRFVPSPRLRDDVGAAHTPRRRSVHIAASPMAYLDLDSAESQSVQDSAAVAPRARRATTRIEQRADVVPQVDSRDVALSVPSPTRYVRDRFVDADTSSSLSSSPVRRSRAVAGEGTVLTPRQAEAPVESPTARLAARARRNEPVVASRPSTLRERSPMVPQERVARRSVARGTDAAPTGAPRPSEPQRPVDVQATAVRRTRQVAPAGTLAHVEERAAVESDTQPSSPARARRERAEARSTHRAADNARPVRVRDVQGRVLRKAAVGTGSVVYASARVASSDSSSDAVRHDGRTRTPRTNATPVRRQRVFKPVAYAPSTRDFSLLAPEASVSPQRDGTPHTRRRVRTPGVRIEASRPLTRSDLEAVIKEVSGVIRAIERSEAPRLTSPAARRMADASAQQVSSPPARFAPRLSMSPMVRTERYTEARQQDGVQASPTRTAGIRASQPARSAGTRRAAPLMGGMPVAAPERAQASESVGYAGQGRSTRSQGLAHAERRVSVARPMSMRAAPMDAVQRDGGGSTVGSASTRRARPMLGETLGQVAQNSAPVGIAQPGAARGSTPTGSDTGRGWARRAQTGSGVPARHTPRHGSGPVADATLADSVNPPVLSAAGTPLDMSRPGTILHALARASSAEDVVRVIMERADGLRGVQKELPGPAVALVERIVRTTDEANVQSANVVAPDALAPLSAPRSSPTMSTAEPAHTSWNGQRSRPARRSQGAGAGQTMRLANKLMRLVHLAENERRLAEAQRHVRMAQEGHEVDSGKETVSGEAVEAPNMKALQREVFESVLREIELSKQRRQEDFDASIWW